MRVSSAHLLFTILVALLGSSVVRGLNCQGARKNTQHCRDRRAAGIPDDVDDDDIKAANNGDADEDLPAYSPPDASNQVVDNAQLQRERLRRQNSPDDFDLPQNGIMGYNNNDYQKMMAIRRRRWSKNQQHANQQQQQGKQQQQQLRNRNNVLNKDDVTVGFALEHLKKPPSRNNYERLMKWRAKQKIEQNRNEVFKNLKDTDKELTKEQIEMEDYIETEKMELKRIYKYKLKHGKWPTKNDDEDSIMTNSDRFTDREVDELEYYVAMNDEALKKVEMDKINNFKESERLYSAEMKRIKSKLREKNEYYAKNGKYKNARDIDKLAEQYSNVEKALENSINDRKTLERRHQTRLKLMAADAQLMKDSDNMDAKTYMKKRLQMRRLEEKHMEPWVTLVKDQDNDLDKLNDKLRKAKMKKKKLDTELEAQSMFKDEHNGLSQGGGVRLDQLEREAKAQDREVKLAQRERAVYLERKNMKERLRERDDDGDKVYDKKEYRTMKKQVDDVLADQLENHLKSDNIHEAVKKTVFDALNQAMLDIDGIE